MRAAEDAGLGLALLLLVFGLAAGSGGAAALSPCEEPRERAAESGHTRAVDCGGHGPALRGPAAVLFGGGLDPNRDDAWALQAVPGVGPARAAAIVAGRARGPYRSLGDLARVRGIGPVTLRRSAAWWRFPADAATGATTR